MKTVIIGLFLLTACVFPGIAGAACQVDARATIPLTVTAGTITLTVELNGKPAIFILDTGAQRSIVTLEAARRLGLARDEYVGTTMRGVGGYGHNERRPNADPASFSVAGVKLERHTLAHDNSLAVAELLRSRVYSPVIDGLLGGDFLSVFDLDLDLPGRSLTLYQVTGCNGRFLPWQGAYAAIPVPIQPDRSIVLPVTLDGKSLRALLDTGAAASILAAPGIARMGLQTAALASDPVSAANGVGPRAVAIRLHRFRILEAGGQTEQAPSLWVAPIRLAPITDMVLGADWIANRRIWISYTTGQLFIAGD